MKAQAMRGCFTPLSIFEKIFPITYKQVMVAQNGLYTASRNQGHKPVLVVIRF